jgi:hypothetical protein
MFTPPPLTILVKLDEDGSPRLTAAKHPRTRKAFPEAPGNSPVALDAHVETLHYF